jgi:hypothetical protein
MVKWYKQGETKGEAPAEILRFLKEDEMEEKLANSSCRLPYRSPHH